MIPVTASLALNPDDLTITHIRASGPGGQNVNKVSSAVQLRFAIADAGLDAEGAERLATFAGSRLTRDGVIVITADRFRTQERNRADAIERLCDLVRRAAERPRPRKATKPSRAVRERRVDEKTRRGALKARRGGRLDLD
jgi:ribosome-associated protein